MMNITKKSILKKLALFMVFLLAFAFVPPGMFIAGLDAEVDVPTQEYLSYVGDDAPEYPGDLEVKLPDGDAGSDIAPPPYFPIIPVV